MQDMFARIAGRYDTMLKALSNVEPRGLISASTNFSEGRLDGGDRLA